MKAKIVKFITEQAEAKGVKIDDTTDLYDTGVFDSLGVIMLLTYLQEELKINFEPDDLEFENYQSIEKIMAWVNSI